MDYTFGGWESGEEAVLKDSAKGGEEEKEKNKNQFLRITGG